MPRNFPLSTFVEDLLEGIESKYGAWRLPKDQVTVTRVTISGVEVPPPTSGALDWDYLMQYPSSINDVTFYFSVSVDASAAPPDAAELKKVVAAVRVYSEDSGERVHGCAAGPCAH